jgi:hypothetical protein
MNFMSPPVRLKKELFSDGGERRTLGEKRRCIRNERRTRSLERKGILELLGRHDCLTRFRRASGERIQRVAQHARFVGRVGVLDLVLQRCLPAGKQHDNEKEPT